MDRYIILLNKSTQKHLSIPLNDGTAVIGIQFALGDLQADATPTAK